MRAKENYTPFVAVAFGLTLGIIILFQMYFWREPGRIEAVEAADQSAAVAAGRDLYAENCSACHGDNGEGGIAPGLNSRDLLQMTGDEALFNLTRTGIPGSTMPAWGTVLSPAQINDVVALLAAWREGDTIYQVPQQWFVCRKRI